MNIITNYDEALKLTSNATQCNTVTGNSYRVVSYNNGWVLRYELNTLKFADALKI